MLAQEKALVPLLEQLLRLPRSEQIAVNQKLADFRRVFRKLPGVVLLQLVERLAERLRRNEVALTDQFQNLPAGIFDLISNRAIQRASCAAANQPRNAQRVQQRLGMWVRRNETA